MTTLSLLILDPEKTVYKGEVLSMSSINTTGPFDVLAFHSNFISIIKDKIIIQETQDQKKELQITQGVMKVEGRTVNIFLS